MARVTHTFVSAIADDATAAAAGEVLPSHWNADHTVSLVSGDVAGALGYTPTNAAVVPSTAPSAGQIPVGNAGGTAYAPVAVSGDATLASTGALTIGNAKVTLAKIANAAANSMLLGSGATGSGASYSEITLGTNLSMSGTTLNATGGGTPGGSSGQLQGNISGAFAAVPNWTFDTTEGTMVYNKTTAPAANFIDFKVNTVSKFNVNTSGDITIACFQSNGASYLNVKAPVIYAGNFGIALTYTGTSGVAAITDGTQNGNFRDLKIRNLIAAGGNGSYIQTPSMTVASLASAATAGAGARAFVTDATATTFLSTVAGGGANKVPVVSDGTNWLIG